jgi:hypothetical protein
VTRQRVQLRELLLVRLVRSLRDATPAETVSLFLLDAQ